MLTFVTADMLAYAVIFYMRGHTFQSPWQLIRYPYQHSDPENYPRCSAKACLLFFSAAKVSFVLFHLRKSFLLFLLYKKKQ